MPYGRKRTKVTLLTMFKMKFLCLIPIISGELNEDCDSLEAGKVCEDDCVAEFAKCAVDCGSNNECVLDLGSLNFS